MYTKNTIMKLVEDEDVEFIRLQFTDIFGIMKNMAVTAGQLQNAIEHGCLFDGAAVDGLARPEESDMYLKPDLDTMAVFPWRPQQGKVARLICDVMKPDGIPSEGDSRYILKKVIREAKDLGYTFNVGPECEFFLFHTDNDGLPTRVTHEQAGYFDLSPLDLGENARRDIILNLEEMGFEIESSHHEIAPAQHEIDFKYGDALKTADNIMTFKLAVKSIAKQHGLHATFMPKPKAGLNGSGMHTHMSLSKNGINIFEDSDDENGLSREAYYFIAGIMKHIRGMSLILNPVVNSYKRLIPGYDAPVYVSWSRINRTPLIRIPAAKGHGTRIELRSPDPACNPYLALALCLAAGLDGISNQLVCPPPINRNNYHMTEKEVESLGIERLPGNLYEAVREFQKDEFVQSVLGKHISEQYMELKMKEWRQYEAEVTDWEIQKYLYKI
ncbi:MAG: glutamine synthetase [Lachnospiraceae bacterium]|jgi:Glutamine synthetase|nr:glutamine synthetase [Lachnospiraceae bacterium]MCI9369280.1 glutamine synthetase [Lachnospiraceae bacterium]